MISSLCVYVNTGKLYKDAEAVEERHRHRYEVISLSLPSIIVIICVILKTRQHSDAGIKTDKEHAIANSLIHRHVLERDRITLLQGYRRTSVLLLLLLLLLLSWGVFSKFQDWSYILH